MKKLPRISLLISIIFCSFNTVLAQENENNSADSLQRVLMKDSLNISDSVISIVFNIRNKFLQESNEINSDTTLSEGTRKSAMRVLIAQTNLGIKNALGTRAFEHYIEIIQRKAALRSPGRQVQPLASQNNN